MYEYEACVADGCYEVQIDDLLGNGMCWLDWDDDGDCNLGEGSFLATINGDTVVWTGEGLSLSLSPKSFAMPLGSALDYDGNGTIGNGDILVMLYYGQTNPPIDPNNDGVVSVQDLLYMLWNVGTAPWSWTSLPERTSITSWSQVFCLWASHVSTTSVDDR